MLLIPGLLLRPVNVNAPFHLGLLDDSQSLHGKQKYSAPDPPRRYCGFRNGPAKRTRIGVHLHAALDPPRRWIADPPWLRAASAPHPRLKPYLRDGLNHLMHGSMTGTSSMTPQRQQLLWADSCPATLTTRRHKSCSVPPLRTCPKMDGWRQLGNRSRRGLGQPKSTTKSWIQEMEPQETFFHAGNGLC
ncbi:unnamed protein product [Boreogadus saida]